MSILACMQSRESSNMHVVSYCNITDQKAEIIYADIIAQDYPSFPRINAALPAYFTVFSYFSNSHRQKFFFSKIKIVHDVFTYSIEHICPFT